MTSVDVDPITTTNTSIADDIETETKPDLGVGVVDVDMVDIDIQTKESPAPAPLTPAEGEGTENPYAYLDRDEFTSENFKIEVRGLPRFYGFKELKKLLQNKLQLNPHKIKPGRSGSGFMYVTFKSEEEKQKALESLQGYKWKNNVLKAISSKAAEDPLIASRRAVKRPHEDDVDADKAENSVGLKLKCEIAEPVEDVIKRATIPWWNVPYEEQLTRKTQTMRDISIDVARKISQVNESIPPIKIRM